jgi:hypothetical protein
MKQSLQLRIRLPEPLAKELEAFPPRMRGRLLSLLWLERKQGVDLNALLSMRQELANLGNLLNQSLRLNQGRMVDTEALRKVIELLRRLHV